MLAAITGVRAGFIVTLYGLATWIVAIPAALILQGPLGAALARVGLAAPVARTIGFGERESSSVFGSDRCNDTLRFSCLLRQSSGAHQLSRMM